MEYFYIRHLTTASPRSIGCEETEREGGGPREPVARMAAPHDGWATGRLRDVTTTADHARARAAPLRPGGAGALTRRTRAGRGADQGPEPVRGGAIRWRTVKGRAAKRPPHNVSGSSASIHHVLRRRRRRHPRSGSRPRSPRRHQMDKRSHSRGSINCSE